MTDKRFELTRRKALAGLGAIGAAGAGAGLGTSALFSDEESFEDNSITAGELDLYVDYTTSVSQDGVDTGSELPNGTLNGNPSSYTYDIDDVKPGDSGSLTFCFALVDNPGYLWLSGELTSESENGTTEPEGDSPWDRQPNGELATYTRASLYYEDQSSGGGETLITEGTIGGILRDLNSGPMPLHGDGDPTAGVLDRPTFGPTEDADNPDDLDFDDVCLRLDWEVPLWVGNEIQGDSLSFDLQFTARQARNNNGDGGWTVVQDTDDLQTAVDNASSGDTLLLASGTHSGSFQVTDSINIRGEGPTNTTYDANTSGATAGMDIQAGNLRVGDLEVTNGGQMVNINDSGDAGRVSDVVLSNIDANGSDQKALVVDYTDNALVRDIETSNPNGDDGLTLWYTHGSQVENVVANDNGDNGIYFNGDNNYLIDSEANNNVDEGIDVNWNDDLDPSEQRVVIDNATAKNNDANDNGAEDIELHDNGTDDSVADDSMLLRKVETGGAPDGLRLGNVDPSEVRTELSSFPNGTVNDGGTDVDI